MHLELVSLLRCPVPHADGWLVASVIKVHDRFIEEGLLGCPTCGAEYAIRSGVTYMSTSDSSDETRIATEVQLRAHEHRTQNMEHSDIVNVGAMLGFVNSTATYALIGYDVERAIALQNLTPAACFVINPQNTHWSGGSIAPVGVLRNESTISLAHGQLHGVIVSRDFSHLLDQAARILRPGGRLVGHSDSPLPTGVQELARDSGFWVAERLPEATTPITLTRR